MLRKMGHSTFYSEKFKQNVDAPILNSFYVRTLTLYLPTYTMNTYSVSRFR